MVKRTLAVVFALAYSLSLALDAEAKMGMNSKLIEGSIAKENIDKVNGNIRWNTNLAQALDQARRENKMVLWIQMIGQMSGST